MLSTQFHKYGDVFCGRWLGESGRANPWQGDIMPRNSPFSIKLTRRERAELISRAGRYRSAYRDVIRAKIVLLASGGLTDDVIGARSARVFFGSVALDWRASNLECSRILVF